MTDVVASGGTRKGPNGTREVWRDGRWVPDDGKRQNGAPSMDGPAPVIRTQGEATGIPTRTGKRTGPRGTPQVCIRGKWISEKIADTWDAYVETRSLARAGEATGQTPANAANCLKRYETVFGVKRPAPAPEAERPPDPVAAVEPAPAPSETKPSERFGPPKPKPEHVAEAPEPATPERDEPDPEPAESSDQQVKAPEPEPGGGAGRSEAPTVHESYRVADASTDEIETAEAHAQRERMAEIVAELHLRMAAVERHVEDFPSPDELPVAIYRHGYRVGWMVAALNLIGSSTGQLLPSQIRELVRVALEPPTPPEWPG